MEKTLFSQYTLSPEILKTLEQMEFSEATEIQRRVFDVLLPEDRDLIGLAQTGTGKTAAFGIPLIEKIMVSQKEGGKQIYSLIMCPTRELAQQVAGQLTKLSSKTTVTVATISGGASYRDQHQALQRKPSIVVATPGRLRDWIERGEIDLSGVRHLILDEADEMLSMGFEEDLDFILGATSTESERKTWLFSATMNKEVRHLTKKYLKNEVLVEVAAQSGQTADQVALVYFTVKEEDKMEALMRLLAFESEFYGLIFCQTKAETAAVAEKLNLQGIPAQPLHGDLKQSDRERVLKKLKAKQITCVVATDVAARGIDVPELTHVVNYHLPRESEVFVHRVGRTGRNGKAGKAWSFVAPYELRTLQKLSRFLKSPLQKAEVPKLKQVRESKVWNHVSQIALTHTTDFKKFKETLSAEEQEKMDQISVESLWAYLLKEDLQERANDNRDLDFVGQGRVPWELNKSGGGDRGGYRRDGGNRYDRGGGYRRGGDRRDGGRRFDRGSNNDRGASAPRKNFEGGVERVERTERVPYRGSNERGASSERKIFSREDRGGDRFKRDEGRGGDRPYRGSGDGKKSFGDKKKFNGPDKRKFGGGKKSDQRARW